MDYIEIFLSFILGAILLVGFVLFLKKFKVSENRYFFFISVLFITFLIGSVIRMIMKFYVGKPPLDQPYTGTALILQIFRVFCLSIGYFAISFHLESTKVKKTHYFFSIFTILTLIITLIALFQRNILMFSVFFLIIASIGLPILFLGLAFKSDGVIRTKAILIAMGFLLIGIATWLDGTERSFFEPYFGEYSVIIAALSINILSIIAWLILIIGFQKKIS